jgi:hypothetical protein
MKLYHGSPQKLKALCPKQAKGLTHFENQNAIFLTKSFLHASLYAISKSLKSKAIFGVTQNKLIIVGNYKPSKGYVYEVDVNANEGERGQYSYNREITDFKIKTVFPKDYLKNIIHVKNKDALFEKMKPKTLYHGSDKRISMLEPREPFQDLKENSMKAVFATDNKNLAIGMALANQKYSASFRSYDKNIINFVRGYPKMKYVYLHYLKTNNFNFNRGGEFISFEKEKPFKIEKIKVSDLKHLWRKSNKKELNEFLKDRKNWKTPKD